MLSPFKKKFMVLTEEDLANVCEVDDTWQQVGFEESYENIPEFCYRAIYEEVAEKGYTLVASCYYEFVNRDENIDFYTKMKTYKLHCGNC